MTLEVIGYEGKAFNNFSVSWGAAVLSDGVKLINSVTGLSVPINELDDLIASGHVSKLKKTIKLEDKQYSDIVLAYVRHSKFKELFVTDTGKTGGLIKHKKIDQDTVYIFNSNAAFTRFAKNIINKIIKKILDVTDFSSESTELLKLGLLLDNSNPYINAIRVVVANHNKKDRVKKLALANVDESKYTEFNDFLRSLEDYQGEYRLHYKDGVTVGGGFDIKYAAKLTNSLQKAHEKISIHMCETHPFFHGAMRSPRLSHMDTGSADLYFKADIKKSTYLEKSARYLELKMIEDLLRGKKYASLDRDPEFRKAIHGVVNLDDSTMLYQVPLSITAAEEEGESVNLEMPITDGEKTETNSFTLLGYQSGLSNDAREIEINLFSSRGIRVSATDNGYGTPPVGVDYLHMESDFLFRPALFTIYRKDIDDKRSKFYLMKVEKLTKNGTYEFDAIPSKVVKDGFCLRKGFNISLTEKGNINLSNENSKTYTINGIEEHINLDSAKDWMNRYFEICFDWELEFGIQDSVSWLKPVRKNVFQEEHRLIYSLGQLGGKAEQKVVIDKINEVFEVTVRDNNTRRIVKDYKKDFLNLKNKTFSLTDKGIKYSDLLKYLLENSILFIKK